MKYFLKRAATSLLALFILEISCFLIIEFLPGNPFEDEVGVKPEIVSQWRERYGYDRPILVRFTLFLANQWSGDIGPSLLAENSAPDFLKARARNSFISGGIAFVLAIFLSVIMSMLVSLWTSMEIFFWKISQFILSIPSLVVIPLAIYFFGFRWQLLPVARLDGLTSWILPIACLSLRPVFSLSRIFVIQVRQISTMDFVRVHRSYGFSRYQTFEKVILKNALLPVLAALPPVLSSLLSGSILVETMFGIPGLGSTYLDSLLNRDLYLLTLLTVGFASILLVTQLLIDLMLVLMDVRIRLESP